MNREVMKERGIKFSREVHATLHNYKLVFRKVNDDGYGYSDIIQSTGDRVEGVAYLTSIQDLNKLDKIEKQYKHIQIQVKTKDKEEITAVAYKMMKKTSKQKPSTKYLNDLKKGAKQHQLPKKYVQGLSSRK